MLRKLIKRLTPKDLRHYQWRAIRFGLMRKYCALFLDMGLGKTVTVLSIIKALLHAGELHDAVLIVGPIRVIYGVWAKEANKWEHTRKLTFSIVHGSQRERLAALDTPADIYLINPEGLVWLLNMLRSKKALNNWPFGMLVIDESSAFKAAGTKRFGKLRHYVHLFKRRVILSGTPTPNSLKEIWPQMFIVDNGERLGTSSDRFEKRFFEPDNVHADYPTMVPREGSEAYIHNLIRDVCLSMEYEDYRKDVPKTLINDVRVQLPPAAREVYDEFEREMFLEMAEGDVEALNAAVLSMKCHQIANGAIYTIDRDTNNKIWELVHDAKMDALEEIVYETGSPILVMYYFKHDFFRLHRRWPKAPYFGKSKNSTLEDEWNAGKHKICFAHPSNAAHGMNLQLGPGHTIAMFSLTWSYERYKQFIARIGFARAMQPVMVHRLVAENTTDEAIINSMERKGNGNRAFINALKEYRHGIQSQTAESLF